MTITTSNNSDEGLKFYTLSEVALRNGKDSEQAWIVIKDSVYDVTSYAEGHPGGAELVLEHAGKDCTKEYQDAGHSTDANKELKGLKIGELVEVIYNDIFESCG